MLKFRFLFTIIFAITVGVLVAVIVMAWTNPTANPPSGNGAISYFNGNVGIGTAAPGYKLDVVGGSMRADGYVAGGQLCMGYASPDCRASWASAGGVPTGAVMFFSLASCPSGWSDFTTTLGGRYVVGLPVGGLLEGGAGTPLSNQENRVVGQHTHAVSDPGHGHTVASGENTGNGPAAQLHVGDAGYHNDPISNSGTGISIQNAGSVAGTNAPYIQLLACKKN